MDNENSKAGFDPLFVRNAIESALRIGLLLVLLSLAYDIVKPFTTPILWGAIIAMAAFPLVKWLESKIGGRRGLAATLVSLFFILALVIPTWSVMEATVEVGALFAKRDAQGTPARRGRSRRRRIFELATKSCHRLDQ